VAATSLSTREIAAELAPFGVELTAPALAQLSTYLELLLRWNRRVNLTGLRQPRLIVRRLFGESLYLSRLVELRGWLVDVGSGPGFEARRPRPARHPHRSPAAQGCLFERSGARLRLLRNRRSYGALRGLG